MKVLLKEEEKKNKDGCLGDKPEGSAVFIILFSYIPREHRTSCGNEANPCWLAHLGLSDEGTELGMPTSQPASHTL